MSPRDEPLLLGVDSGGTKTRARLTSVSGAVLGQAMAGPGNIYTDESGSRDNVESAIADAFGEAGLGYSDRARTRLCLGLAGLDPKKRRLPAGWSFSEFASCRVETDAFIALYGAHGGRNGAVLVVGTGVVGLALKDGRRSSVGGYGPSLSDEGGGAWIGKEAVRRTLWSVDGRASPSPLTDAVSTRLGPPEAVLEWAKQASAADYGSFAPLVLRAAQDNDANAEGILADAVIYLDRILKRLARFGVERVSVLGGLAEGLRPRLDFSGMELHAPLGSALAGAVLLAAAD